MNLNELHRPIKFEDSYLIRLHTSGCLIGCYFIHKGRIRDQYGSFFPPLRGKFTHKNYT